MSELRGLEQQLVNLKDQCWNLEQKISYLCECLGGVQTALERGRENGQCPECDGLGGGHVLPCSRSRVKPAPVVEKYRAFEFTEAQHKLVNGVQEAVTVYYRRPIGEVVATLKDNENGEGYWHLQFPDGTPAIYSIDSYNLMRDLFVKCGSWERTND